MTSHARDSGRSRYCLRLGGRPGSRPHCLAFTLVELVVVIAILSVLAAIVLPVFVSARETSRRATCLANLRNISLAFAMYIDDWDGCFPNTGDPYLWMGRHWRWPLKPYLGTSLERDPGDPEDPLISAHTPGFLLCPSDPFANDKWDATSYGYSAAFYHTPGQIRAMTTEDLWKEDRFPCITQHESSVVFPSQKILVAEWLTNHERDKLTWWDWGGARNYLFVDGHAGHLRTDRISPAGNGLPDPNLTVGGLTGRDIE
jgi:prepilin-type N-terminal cleavage/methylation domain-containing protein/prepilin-type processing-associated H-X9-DG protein